MAGDNLYRLMIQRSTGASWSCIPGISRLAGTYR